MGEPVKPVFGLIKGNRYVARFERTDDGGAVFVQVEVGGDTYTPTEKGGFRGTLGHETERGLSVVRALPNGRYAVTRPDSTEPLTATSTGMEFLDACEFAAKHAAASILRDKEAKGL